MTLFNINKIKKMNNFYNLKVIEKQRLTPESVSLTLKVPKNLEDKFRFNPGQFVIVEKEINGDKLKRYYSIYNNPDEVKLKLGIKHKGADGFADYALHNLQPGENLHVSPPMNDVPFDTQTQDPQKLLAITIGSGITPFFSYIQYMLKHQPKTKLVLVYGNENPEKTMFYKELEELVKQHPNQLKIYHAFSKYTPESGNFDSRISADILQKVLEKDGTDFDAVYMIGPDDLKKMAAKVLQKAGIEKEKLHYRVYS